MHGKPKHLLTDTVTVSPLDVHFAQFLSRLDGEGNPVLPVAAALVSHCTRIGHVCVDLREVGDDLAIEGLLDGDAAGRPTVGKWPSLLKSTSVVGPEGAFKPLILDPNDRLYLYRYWQYQERLASWLWDKAGGISRTDALEESKADELQMSLQRLFFHKAGQSDEKTGEGIDWQVVAAVAAVRKRLCVISGGPGTGKTTVVCRILALLLSHFGPTVGTITLAAPTGKAAARLQESVRRFKASLNAAPAVTEAIPETATTIHRLLGVIPGSREFSYNRENRLPTDVLVVDEASMVDLALLSKLVQALSPAAMLILLGDKNQLASVEAGAVLADICNPRRLHRFSRDFCRDVQRYTGYDLEECQESIPDDGLQDCIVELRRSYRFASDSGIRKVSDLVNKGDGAAALDRLKSGGYADVQWVGLPPAGHLAAALEKRAVGAFEQYLRAEDIETAFARFDEFCVLCALREGPYGMKNINGRIEERLRAHSLISAHDPWYRGRPVMITRNDYALGVFNGDVGILWPDGEQVVAVFRTVGGRIRRFHPARLPEHETVYAMTVHKSQGSEFDKVLLILPGTAHPLVTRELIYTGFTRARRQVEIWAEEAAFVSGVSTQTRRMSGLHDRLWGSRRGGGNQEGGSNRTP